MLNNTLCTLFFCVMSIFSIYSMNVYIEPDSPANLTQELFDELKSILLIDPDVIRGLIAHGADVNAFDEYGLTPLIWASWRKRGEVCQILLDHNAAIDMQCILIPMGPFRFKVTPLMVAARLGNTALCKYFIERGAQVNIKSESTSNWTALAAAARGNHNPTCQLLLDNGAQVEEALDLNCSLSTHNLLIRYPSFIRRIPKGEFQTSRQRIWTALCMFKRRHPAIPKDIRKLILCSNPELKQDLLNSAALDIYSGIKSEEIPYIPNEVLQLLVHNNKLGTEQVILALKEHHFVSIKPLLLTAMRPEHSEVTRAFLNPDYFEKNHGEAIEQNIRSKLKLETEASPKCTIQ